MKTTEDALIALDVVADDLGVAGFADDDDYRRAARRVREAIDLLRDALSAQERALEEAQKAQAFLLRLADTSGAIVSSGCAHVMEIADAQARGDWLVIDSLGFILRFREWREEAEEARQENERLKGELKAAHHAADAIESIRVDESKEATKRIANLNRMIVSQQDNYTARANLAAENFELKTEIATLEGELETAKQRAITSERLRMEDAHSHIAERRQDQEAVQHWKTQAAQARAEGRRQHAKTTACYLRGLATDYAEHGVGAAREALEHAATEIEALAQREETPGEKGGEG